MVCDRFQLKVVLLAKLGLIASRTAEHGRTKNR